jgi:L-ascorbate metabolism protein UlaG (beta-lactamase superfamily)
MKLTKYEHACFTLEKNGQVLVVDPGSFTTDFVVPENVAAIVITHEHGDHFDPDMLAAIYSKNPSSLLLADQSVIKLLPDHPGRAVRPGETVSVGEFRLEFFGGQHASIHSSLTSIANLGILIDERLYYPGDSFYVPDVAVDTLALPVTAPWLKIGEVMDFMVAVRPRAAFPTHDAIASKIGKDLVDRLVGAAASAHGIVYSRLSGAIEIT